MANNHTSHNCNVFFYGLHFKPVITSVSWIDDYCKIEWTDFYCGSVQYEIWEEKFGSGIKFAGLSVLGANSFNCYTEQNALMKFYVRAVNQESLSPFSDASDTIKTPLVFKTDQSVLTPVVFTDFNVLGVPGLNVNVNWGDGTDDNFGTGIHLNVTKNYAIQKNPYFITLSGDVDWLTNIEITAQTVLYGDLSKWNLPFILKWHFYNNSFTGNISEWFKYFPDTLELWHIGWEGFTGDLTEWDDLSKFPALWDWHLHDNDFTADWTNLKFSNIHQDFVVQNNRLSGNVQNWVFPDTMVLCNLYNNLFFGSVDNWNCPASILQFRIHNNNLSGSLNLFLIPDGAAGILIELQNNKLTGLPRGSFRWVYKIDASGNNCSSAEIENFLGYIDNYFSGGVVPLTDCVYNLTGVNMGSPTAQTLIYKASIEAKYIAATFAATINLNP